MKILKSFLRSIFEDVVNTNNRFLFGCWCLAVILIVFFGLFVNSESVGILGLAESHEFQVSFDSAVEIKQVHVLPGQVVKKGDLLLELSQENLNLQIRVLKSKYEKLSAELKLRQQISSLTRDMTRLPQSADPLQVELSSIKSEIDILEKRLRSLFVFAEVDGAVGAVNFKNGEKAPAFSSLLTLVPLNPTYINGYVNENLISTVKVGQMVEVFSNSGHSVYGRIINIGSRIVPIPQRLLRIPTLSAWGREVVVKIPSNNQLIVGEKVSVKKTWGLSIFSAAQAGEEELKWKNVGSGINEIGFPSSITNRFSPEISGLVFLPELRKFALIADDYPQSRPLILLMDELGEVSEQMLPVEGLQEMKDIESISMEGSYLYLLSSMSSNRKHVSKKSRQLFAKVKREGLNLFLENVVDLRKTLFSAMKKSEDPELRKIIELGTGEEDFEVEGHFVANNELFISLKHPVLIPNEGLILRIKSLHRLFEQKTLSAADISVAYRFNITLPDRQVTSVLTDIINVENTIYAATSCRAEKCSAIWKLRDDAKFPELIAEFNENKLEGIAVLPQSKKIYGVFDHKRSKFVTIPYKSLKGPE